MVKYTRFNIEKTFMQQEKITYTTSINRSNKAVNRTKNKNVDNKDISTDNKEVVNKDKRVVDELFEANLKDSGLEHLAKILTGEMQLRKKEDQIKKFKKQAIEKQKKLNRAKIRKGEVVLEKEVSEFEDPRSSNPNERVIQKLTLFKWEAPVRITFSYSNKMFLILLALSLVFILYLALLGHYGLMFSLIALLFFVYVAGTTEPVNTEHLITTRGVETFDKLYEWYMLEDFWFSKKNDQYLLIIQTKLRLPTKLMMIVDKEDVTTIFLLLQDKLLYKDIKKYSKIDGWAYGEYIPIEDV